MLVCTDTRVKKRIRCLVYERRNTDATGRKPYMNYNMLELYVQKIYDTFTFDLKVLIVHHLKVLFHVYSKRTHCENRNFKNRQKHIR